MIWLIVGGALVAAVCLFFTVLSIQTEMHRRDKPRPTCGCYRQRGNGREVQ